MESLKIIHKKADKKKKETQKRWKKQKRDRKMIDLNPIT